MGSEMCIRDRCGVPAGPFRRLSGSAVSLPAAPAAHGRRRALSPRLSRLRVCKSFFSIQLNMNNKYHAIFVSAERCAIAPRCRRGPRAVKISRSPPIHGRRAPRRVAVRSSRPRARGAPSRLAAGSQPPGTALPHQHPPHTYARHHAPHLDGHWAPHAHTRFVWRPPHTCRLHTVATAGTPRSRLRASARRRRLTCLLYTSPSPRDS